MIIDDDYAIVIDVVRDIRNGKDAAESIAAYRKRAEARAAREIAAYFAGRRPNELMRADFVAECIESLWGQP